MTQLKDLTNEELRIKANEARGWKLHDFSLKEWRDAGYVTPPRKVWLEPGAYEVSPAWCSGLEDRAFPDPTTDHNDAFEFAKVLPEGLWLQIDWEPNPKKNSNVNVRSMELAPKGGYGLISCVFGPSLSLAITLAVLAALAVIEAKETTHASDS